MKPDTYDTIIDTTKELFGYSGWLLLATCIVGVALALVWWVVFEFLEIELSIMMLSIVDLTISFLIITFAFMVKKTKERFSVKQWRDFWMAFGHAIEISISNDKSTKEMERELKGWLDENTPRLYRIMIRDNRFQDEKIKIVFRHRTDAVACKLKWG